MSYEYKQFYNRKLPHRHSPGTTLFVTYRLKDSIPRVVIDQWKRERRLLENECARLLVSGQDVQIVLQDLQERFRRRWFGKFEDDCT